MTDGTIGARVRVLRERAGLTQEELAGSAGLGVRTIRDLESGKVRRPRGPSLRMLAAALKVTTEGLLGAGGPAPWIGSQLPADDADFTGRSSASRQLADLLVPPGGTPTGVPVAVVAGRSGIGKTALAVHVAHKVRDRFPDGQLYVRLGGEDPVEPTEVLGRFLRALGVNGATIAPTLEERAADYRARLTDRQVLVVLDNAADEAQVRPLLPGTVGNAVLVTSRSPLSGLLGARSMVLDVLDQEQSFELLGRIVGVDRIAADAEAAHRVARASDGLPLALRIAGARSAAPTGMPLMELAARLDDDRRRLDELSVGDIAVRAAFEVGYRELDTPGRRAYRLVGLLRAREVPAWAVAALLDTDGPVGAAVAEQLVTARLFDRHGDGPATHYRMHDLTRLDARDRAEAEDPAEDRQAAVRRALSGWLNLADEGDRRLESDTMPLPDPLPAGWRPDDRTVEALLARPLDWFETEREALVEATRQSTTEAPELTAGLVDRTVDFFATRYHPDDWVTVAEELRRSAVTRGDRRLAGHALRRLAEVQIFLHRNFAAAESLVRQAVVECDAVGDDAGVGAARLQLGSVLRFAGRHPEALTELVAARHALLAAGNRTAAAHVDADLGFVLLSLGRYAEAREHLDAAERTLRTVGDVRGQANALNGLSTAQLENGEPAAAVASLQQALALLEGIGDRRLVSVNRAMLGWAEVEAGDPVAALVQLRAALEDAEELRAPANEGISRCGLGEAYRRLGEPAAAQAEFDAAGALLRQAGLSHWVGRVELGLGRLAARAGDGALARDHLVRAVELLGGWLRHGWSRPIRRRSSLAVRAEPVASAVVYASTPARTAASGAPESASAHACSDRK